MVALTGSTFSSDSASIGGAIDNGDGGTGTVTVASTTFSDDNAAQAGGATENGYGGTGL